MGIQLRGGWGAAVMVRNLQLSANLSSLCEEENTSGMWLSQPALGALGGCFQSEMEGLQKGKGHAPCATRNETLFQTKTSPRRAEL